MSNNDVTFYFGRLNLIASYKDKYEFLQETLTRNIEVSKRDYEWGFFNVRDVYWNNIVFLAGFLVKYKSFKDEDVVDEQSRLLTTTTISNRAIAASPFFLHPKTGIIAFHPISFKIGHNQFKYIFPELVMASNDYLLVDADLQFIDEEVKIFEAIKSFDKITSLVIQLHPSNPSNRERWKRTDERLQEMKAQKYRQQYYSTDGLIILEDSEPFGDIIMAGDGYGKADIYGEKDGKPYVASTDRIPLKAKGVKSSSLQDTLESIIDKFEEIWDRMRH